jgi:hypothetical protein
VEVQMSTLVNRHSVEDWIRANLQGEWKIIVFISAPTMTPAMAVYFKDPRDAVLFKISDGYQGTTE